jgi:hypothetical protein
MNRGHPSNQGGQATNDESGLIDIQALMAASRSAERAPSPPRAEGTPVPVVSNLAVYPFGAPEPLEPAPPPEPIEPVRPRRFAPRSVVIPVLGAVALAGVVMGVLLARPPQGNEGPARAGAAGEVATPEPPAPPKVETAPLPEPPKPAESGAVDAVKPPVVKPPVVKQPVVKQPVKPPVVKQPVKTPPASPCNGDLRCEIERAAKR